MRGSLVLWDGGKWGDVFDCRWRGLLVLRDQGCEMAGAGQSHINKNGFLSSSCVISYIYAYVSPEPHSVLCTLLHGSYCNLVIPGANHWVN